MARKTCSSAVLSEPEFRVSRIPQAASAGTLPLSVINREEPASR